MQHQTITLQVNNATDMNAFVATPGDKKPHAAVIVLQEAYGVNHHIRNITEKISVEGYVAIAPELFHRTAPAGFESGYANFESVKPHMAALTPEGLVEDLKATYEWLQGNDYVIKSKIAAIGFCLGGRVSFLANASFPLAASVSYYGGSMHLMAEKARDLRAPLLLFWGGLDKHILPEHREIITKALDEAKKDYINTVISYADHGFNCDERASYSPKAASEAWAMTLAFLKNNLSH